MRNVSFLKLSALLAGEEPQGGGGAEHLACPQHRGGELRVRGAARIVLGLQGKAAVLPHGLAALARGGAGQSCKKLPVYSWMPGWVVYSFMLMPVLSLVAHAQMLWLEPRARSMT